jgi:hypothetical protein
MHKLTMLHINQYKKGCPRKRPRCIEWITRSRKPKNDRQYKVPTEKERKDKEWATGEEPGTPLFILVNVQHSKLMHIQYWYIDGKYRIYVARLRNGGKTNLFTILHFFFCWNFVLSVVLRFTASCYSFDTSWTFS